MFMTSLGDMQNARPFAPNRVPRRRGLIRFRAASCTKCLKRQNLDRAHRIKTQRMNSLAAAPLGCRPYMLSHG